MSEHKILISEGPNGHRILESGIKDIPLVRGLPPAPPVNIPGADYLQTREGAELFRAGVMDYENLGPGQKKQFNAILEAYPEAQEIAHRMRAIQEMQDTEPQRKRMETLQDVANYVGTTLGEGIQSGDGNVKLLWDMVNAFNSGMAEVYSPLHGMKKLDVAIGGDSFEGSMSDRLADIFTKTGMEPVEPGDKGRWYVTSTLGGPGHWVEIEHTQSSAIATNFVKGAVRLAPELVAGLMDNPYEFAKGFITFPIEEIKLILQAIDFDQFPRGPGGEAIDLPWQFTPEEVAAARKEIMRNPLGVAMIGLMAVGVAGRVSKGVKAKQGRILANEKMLSELVEGRKKADADFAAADAKFRETEVRGVADKESFTKLLEEQEAKTAAEKDVRQSLEGREKLREQLEKEQTEAGKAEIERQLDESFKDLEKNQEALDEAYAKKTGEDVSDVPKPEEMSRSDLIMEAHELQKNKVDAADQIPPGELVKLPRETLEKMVKGEGVDMAEIVSKQKELTETRAKVEDLEAQKVKAEQELKKINDEWRPLKNRKLTKPEQKVKVEVKTRRDAARSEVERIESELSKAKETLEPLERSESVGAAKPVERPEPKEAPRETELDLKPPQEPVGEATGPKDKPLPTQKEVAEKRSDQVTAEELARAKKQKAEAEESQVKNEIAIGELKESVGEASKGDKPILVVMQKNLEAQQARDKAIIAEAESIIADAAEHGVRVTEEPKPTVAKKSTAPPKSEAKEPTKLKEEPKSKPVEPKPTVKTEKSSPVEKPAPIKEGTEGMIASRNLGHHKDYVRRLEEKMADPKMREKYPNMEEELRVARVDEAKYQAEVDRIRSEALDRQSSAEIEDFGIRTEKIENVKLDPKRFQNREAEFSEESVTRIMTDFDPAKFDPVVVWKDPKTGDNILLSGHSRYEAMRRMEKTDIPVREYKGTEAEAINFAKVEANRLQTTEGLKADIRAYQMAKDAGATKQQLVNSFGSERLGNLEAWTKLNPKGNFIDALTNPASDSFPYIKRWARNVGELRKEFPELTNHHEKQMFDAIYRDPGLVNLAKADFMDMVEKQVNDMMWKPEQPLIFKKGQIPVTGARARADTGRLMARIDKLEQARKEARTPEEHQVLTDEIAKLKAGITDIMSRQGGFELGAFGTPSDYKALGDAVKTGIEKMEVPPGVEVVPVQTESYVTVVRKPKDWKTTDAVKSPSRSYRKLNPAAGDIADMGANAIRSYTAGLEKANVELNKIFYDLRSTTKQKATGESVAGWFTYKKTFREAKHTLIDYLDRKVTDAEILKLPGEIRQAYWSTKQWYESYRQRIIKERRAQGLEVYEDWGVSDYLTHMFKGNWRLESTTKGVTSLIEGGIGETEAAVMKKAKAMLKDDPTLNLTIRWDTNIPHDMVTRLSKAEYTRLIKHLAEKTHLSPTEVRWMVAESNVGVKPSRTKHYRFGVQRKGTKGYSTNLLDVLEVYAATTERYLAMNKFRREATPLLDQINNQPQLKEQVAEYIDIVSGKRVRGSVEFDNFLQQLPLGIGAHIKPMALERWTRKATKLQAMRLLSRPSTAITNRTQTLTTVYPRVGAKIFKWAEKEAHTERGRLFAEQHNVHQYVPNFFTESALTSKGMKMKLSDAPLKLFSLAEQTNRRSAFLAGHKYAKDVLKYSEADAVAYGLGMVRRTQFDNSIADIQPIFRHPVMKVIGQFKAFQFKYIEQLWDLRGKEIPRAVAAHFIVGGAKTVAKPISWLKAGAMYELYDYLSDEYGKETADFISFGLPGLLGADMSASLGADVIPYGNDAKEQAVNFLAGPTGSMVFDISATIDDWAKAPPTERSAVLMRGGQKVLPLTKLGVAGYDLVTKEHDLKDTQDRTVLEDLSSREMLSRIIGLRLLRESLAWELSDMSDKNKADRVAAKKEWYNLTMAGDIEGAIKVLDDYDNEIMKMDRFIMPITNTEINQYFGSTYSRELDSKLSQGVPGYNVWIQEQLENIVEGRK